MSQLGISIVGSLLNALLGRSAPYDSAKATMYTMDQLANKTDDYNMIQNAATPPLDRSFKVMKDGKPTWLPAVNSRNNIFAFSGSGDPAKAQAQYLQSVLAGAETQLPKDKMQPDNKISQLLSSLGI